MCQGWDFLDLERFQLRQKNRQNGFSHACSCIRGNGRHKPFEILSIDFEMRGLRGGTERLTMEKKEMNRQLHEANQKLICQKDLCILEFHLTSHGLGRQGDF